MPRVAFVNKLDRAGANPWKVINDLRKSLRLNAAAVQVPIGLEGEHSGVVDLIERKGYVFEGSRGENVSHSHRQDAYRRRKKGLTHGSMTCGDRW